MRRFVHTYTHTQGILSTCKGLWDLDSGRIFCPWGGCGLEKGEARRFVLWGKAPKTCAGLAFLALSPLVPPMLGGWEVQPRGGLWSNSLSQWFVWGMGGQGLFSGWMEAQEGAGASASGRDPGSRWGLMSKEPGYSSPWSIHAAL